MKKADSNEPATDEQPVGDFGAAIDNLRKLVTQSIQKGHTRSALGAQKELIGLLGLRAPADDPASDIGAAAELANVREHLLTLDLTNDPNTPTTELARLAVLRAVGCQ